MVSQHPNSFKTRRTLNTYGLDAEGYACKISKDNKELYISCWGCDKVLIFDTERRTVSGEIPVGDNPNDLCLTRNGRRLFVANANDNSVSVIDLLFAVGPAAAAHCRPIAADTIAGTG